MSLLLYQKLQPKNKHSRVIWVLVPILLILIGFGFLTGNIDRFIIASQNVFYSIPEKIQEMKQNSRYTANARDSNEDYLEGISIKDILQGGAKYEIQESASVPSVDAFSYVVGDVLTGEIILEKNAIQELPIASVTKLMTASVALNELKETHIATVSKKATQTESSRGMLRANEKIEVSDLLYPLLLVSSNDAAEVLAETFGEKYFIQSMNRHAREIGMNQTSFDDPSGLSERNISTARDLFYLSEYLYNNHDNVFEITKLKEYTQGGRVWKNANTLVGTNNYEGGKTGYTSKAGRTGVALFKIPFEGYGERVIAITLLRTDNRTEDYNKLLEFVSNYVNYITPQQKSLTQGESDDVVNLAFIGDLMFDRGVKSSVIKNFNGDYIKLFDNLKDIKDADIAFANLEGPISLRGKNVGSKYSFRFEPIIAQVIKNAGIDIVSFANNHVGDWSLQAFEDTLNHLREQNVLFTGAGNNKKLASEVTIIESKGIKIGFLAFSDVGPNWIETQEHESGQLLASDPNRLLYIQNAKKKVDILVVSYHWGDEYVVHNTRQTTLAYSSIDNGADIIIGHHPHVIQDIEIYNNKLIAYSLGNAIFDQYFSEETMKGMLLLVQVNKKGIVSHTKKIFSLNKEYQPQKPEYIETVSKYEDGIIQTFEELSMYIKESEKNSSCPKALTRTKNLFFFNASQKNALPDNFIPKNLVEIPEQFIPTQGRNICITKETLEAFYAMYKDAKEDGVNIIPTSGFRSVSTQEQLYTKQQNKNSNTQYISIAPPRHSEHHLGTTLDITSEEIDFQSASEKFATTKTYQWLKDNAHLYGFVQSYQSGQESITGYVAESWHWRYLEPRHAQEIKNTGITIIEYLNQEKNLSQ